MSDFASPSLLPLERPGTGLRIGLLAGSGRFPIAFAEAARRAGHAVHCVGVEGLFSEELRELCDSVGTTPLSKIGRAIRLFKRRQINRGRD